MDNDIKIEIWSDVACPFCYIGRAHLEQALEKFEFAGDVEIEWKSFLLDPSLPASTDQNLYASLAERKGMSMEQVMQMTGRVSEMAGAAGLALNFDKVKPVTTREAHKILQLAKRQGLGDEVKKRLFEAYFTEGVDIADSKSLVDIGKAAGLDEKEILAALEDPDIAKAVNSNIDQARALGISGVPYFVIDGKYALSGAQPADVMLRAIEQVHHEKVEAAEVNQAAATSCKPDGDCD